MKLTVLASGSSGNGYVLEGRTSALIIECGVPPERAFRETHISPSKVSGCLVSHEHGDHAAYADRYARLGMTVYASLGTIRGAGLWECPRVLSLAAGRPAQVGEFTVIPFETEHDAAEPLGYSIHHPELGRLVFATDTRKMPYAFIGADHVLIEANWSGPILDGRVMAGEEDIDRAARIKNTHLSLEQACEFVRRTDSWDLKHVILIHLSGRNSDAVDFAAQIRKSVRLAAVDVARPGLTVELNKHTF